jgi:sporulation protein YlmC with PRC-barrel domain
MRTIVNAAWVGVALAAFAFTVSAWADEPAQNRNNNAANNPANNANNNSNNNAAVDQTHVAIARDFRTSDIIGLYVKNKNHEDLGKIDDLVIDMKNGEVRYAAIAYGGVAGIGSKLFAVPWQKLTFMFGEPNKANSRHFMLDASKEQFENSPGFDSSHWPNVADSNWAASVDKHYNFDRTAHNNANAPAHANSGTANANTDNARQQTVAYETVFRASKIKGMEVRNDKNEHLGDIDDMVIDVSKGHVKYLALSYGSWFTGGNKLFAVPLSSFTLTHDNNKTFFTVHVSQGSLKNAPGFDKNNWPDTADPNWAKGIDSYYERTAQRPATTRQ